MDATFEPRIGEWLSFVLILPIGFGISFQLPLVMFFLAKIGIVTPDFLRGARKYAIVIIIVVAGVITPPDVISQLIVSFPLLLLYEVSIWLSSRVVKEQKEREEKEDAEWS